MMLLAHLPVASLFALALMALAPENIVLAERGAISGKVWSWDHVVAQWVVDPAGRGTLFYTERKRIIARKRFAVGTAGYRAMRALMVPVDKAALDGWTCTPVMTDSYLGYIGGFAGDRAYKMHLSAFCNATIQRDASGTTTSMAGDPRAEPLEAALGAAHKLVLRWTRNIPVTDRFPANSPTAKRLMSSDAD